MANIRVIALALSNDSRPDRFGTAGRPPPRFRIRCGQSDKYRANDVPLHATALPCVMYTTHCAPVPRRQPKTQLPMVASLQQVREVSVSHGNYFAQCICSWLSSIARRANHRCRPPAIGGRRRRRSSSMTSSVALLGGRLVGRSFRIAISLRSGRGCSGRRCVAPAGERESRRRRGSNRSVFGFCATKGFNALL
jgi:hypothetical protein